MSSKQIAAYEDSMSIKIIRHLTLVSDLHICKTKSGNPRDQHVAVVCKGDEILGHVNRCISTICSISIRHGEIIYFKVSGG